MKKIINVLKWLFFLFIIGYWCTYGFYYVVLEPRAYFSSHCR